MTRLLIATNNKGKVEEIQDLLKDLSVELVTPAQIDLKLDVHEDGHTYAENASKKAFAFAQASGLISLADDSGLEVDALDGAPGLYSARYDSLPLNSKNLEGTGKGSDAGRRTLLIQNLQDKPRPWTARFHATIAIAIPTKHVTLSATKGLLPSEEKIHLTEGICEGEIIPEKRGTGGFGYDPIFLLQDLGKTMAELSMDEKNRLSHRAKAVMKAKEILLKILVRFNNRPLA